jgi:WD40 repeat protein
VQANEPISAAFSPDDQDLVVPDCQLGMVGLWGVAAHREVAALKLPGGPSPLAHDRTGRRTTGGPHSLAFSPEGKSLVAVAPRSVAVWDLAGTPERRVLARHDGGIPGLVFSPDGTRLATASKDETVRIWDPLTGRVLKRLDRFRGPLQAIAYSPDGRWLATAGQADDLRIWDVESSGHRAVPDHGLSSWLWSVGFSPDGRHFAACGSGGLALWRLAPDDSAPGASPGLREIARPTKRPTTSLGFSPDGRLLAWVETDRTLNLWDIERSRTHPPPPAKLAGGVLSVAFLDSRRLGFVDEALVAEVWDVIAGRRVSSFGVGGVAARRGIFLGPVIAASRDGRLLASQDGRSATIWDTEAGRLLIALPEERGVTWSLAWSPDHRLLAVGSSDGGLAIWDLPMVRAQLADLGLDWGSPSRPGIRPR